MIIDAHLHCSGEETPAGVLQALDEAGIEIGVLLAPFLNGKYTLHDPARLREANQYLARLIRGHADRLIGFAVVNPALPGAADDLRHAIETLGLRGLKTVPTGWYPYDDCAHRLYEAAAQLSIPILFHAGVFIDGISGRFCRPMYFEALRAHPNLRVTLAHLGWPWCDEANALGLIDLIKGVAADDCQFRFDISFGAPPVYRQEVLHKAVEVLTPGLLQFGSDRFFPCSGAHIRAMVDEVTRLFACLDLPAAARERIMYGTAAAWLGIGKTSTLNPSPFKERELISPIWISH